MQKNNSPTEKKSPPKDDLLEKLKAASRDLFYISETDAPFEAFLWKQETKNEKIAQISPEMILKREGYPKGAPVQETTLEAFFAHPTAMQDWFGEEEKRQAESFLNLRKLLEKELREIKVFKIGEIQLDIYIIGIDRDGNPAGIKTKAVET